jgi:hypothetical protein
MVVDLYRKFRKGAFDYKDSVKLHDERGIHYEPYLWQKKE